MRGAILFAWLALAGAAVAGGAFAPTPEDEARYAANAAAFAAEQARLAIPAEVSRIAYDTGWSEAVIDGVSVTWRTHNSPFDPATDAANKAQALGVASNNTVDLKALRADLTNDIAQSEAMIATSTGIVASVQALTFNAAYNRAQVQALSAQVVELSKLVRDLTREDKDRVQADRKLRKAIMQEAD
jgi:hypothetical protein